MGPNDARGRASGQHSREVERLVKAAGENRNGHRDSTMVLVAYRHGLRAAEMVALRWDSVDFGRAQLHVSRIENGTPSVHSDLGLRAAHAAAP